MYKHHQEFPIHKKIIPILRCPFMLVYYQMNCTHSLTCFWLHLFFNTCYFIHECVEVLSFTIIIIELDLNRGVPMGRSTQIMGGNFRRGLHSDVVTFSTRLAVQPSPLYKSNGEKSKMAAPYFCILPSDWPKCTYYSFQVQLYV